MAKLDKLTDAQVDALVPHRDAWLRAGLSTEPADRAAAEAGVVLAYERAGLTPPRVVVWLRSPLEGCVGAAMLKSDQVADRDQVADQVRDRVRDQVSDQVSDRVLGQVWGQVRGQVRDQVADHLRGAVYGQHDAGWLSFYDYFHTATGLPGVDKLDGLVRVARSAGWWWPLRGAVILTERHNQLHRDQQGRLHNESGPAVAYPDGWGVHAWHGVRVPADLIEVGWSTDRILQEPNAEVRRCAIERMGWDRFIAEANLAQVGVSEPDPGNPGHELALYDVPARIYDEPVRVLLCTNGTVERDGTRRRFGLTVPASIDTPVAAAAWGYGLTVDQYASAQRRA